MTWPRFLIGWLVVACITGPYIGRMLRTRRLELEAEQVWARLPKLDQPDPEDQTLMRFERSTWNNKGD